MILSNIRLNHIIIYLFIIFFTINESYAQINFNPQTVYYNAGNHNFCESNDFNNDGLNDFIMSSGLGSLNAIWVYKQYNGDLLIQDTIPLTQMTSYLVRSMDSGDLNNDGLTDLAVTFNDTVKIFFQQPFNGFFDDLDFQIFQPDSGKQIHGLACGDLNHDGLMDFAVTHYQNENLNVYYQNFNQTFNKVTYYKKIAGRNDLIITDMNNDGFNDLIVSNGTIYSSMAANTNKYSFSIFIQDTVSNLLMSPNYYAIDTITPNYWAANYTNGISVGDLNNDGFKDIVTTHSQEAYLWYHVPGNSFFFPNHPDTLLTYINPDPVFINDFNNDGKNEIMISHGGTSDITIYESDSNYVFSNYSVFQLWNYSNNEQQSIAVVDLNSDSLLDIASTFDFGFCVLQNASITLDLIENTFNNQSSLIIYPNPASDYCVIKYNASGKDKYMQILNLNGEIIFTSSINDSEINLNVSTWPNGIYIIKYSNSVKEYNEILLINH